MSLKTSVFIATSLDGYISRNDGSIDWLNAANALVPPGEDCGYSTFMASIDVCIMGRNTYEQVLTFGEWPYGQCQVVVLSSQALQIPKLLRATVSASSETPVALFARLASQGLTHAYVDGGVTIQRFLQARLVDDLTITIIPILLGEGRPLFGPLEKDVHLKLVSSHAYDFGFVQLKYTSG